MLNATVTAFVVTHALEAALIIIGNMFAIFVFWTQKLHHKQSCFLLINLAVADLLVGVTEPIVLATEKIPKMKIVGLGGKAKLLTNPSSSFQLLASSASLFFLALISLERVFAVLWPLRHRVMNTRVYICSIATVWAVGICMAGLSVLPIYYTKVNRKYVIFANHACLFISLLVICASYLRIRTRLRCTPADIQVHERQNTEHNLRLSRTIFIAITVSLVFWLPAFVVYVTNEFCLRCFSPPVVWSVNVLHLANSMVNPLVYTFRMPIFKNALKKMLQKQRQNVEMRPFKPRWPSLGSKGFFAPKMEHSHTSDINLTCYRSTNDSID